MDAAVAAAGVTGIETLGGAGIGGAAGAGSAAAGCGLATMARKESALWLTASLVGTTVGGVDAGGASVAGCLPAGSAGALSKIARNDSVFGPTTDFGAEADRDAGFSRATAPRMGWSILIRAGKVQSPHHSYYLLFLSLCEY